MDEISMKEKIKFLMKLAKLQGFVGISQIKEIAVNLSEEEFIIQKLKKNSVEINNFLRTVYNYKTISYQTKKENKFTLTTRINENGESFILDTVYEKELFEKMSYARDNMLKFAFRSGEIREFIYKISDKIRNGTLKIYAVINCEKEDEKNEEQKKAFLETIEQIKKIEEEISESKKENKLKQKSVDLFISLNFTEKTKGIIYNKFTHTKEYMNDIIDELYNYERIYSNSKREIIEANIRLVFSIAKEYGAVHKGILDISDIIQEGNIGLIDAVESFDADKGSKFSSWAVWYIRRQIWSAVNSFKNTVYIPPKASTDIYKISAWEEKYKLLNGKNPTATEIAKEFNLKEKQIISLKSSDFCNINPDYESALCDNNYSEKVDGLNQKKQNPFDVLAASGLKKNINAILEKIGKREREIIELYFGLLNDKEQMNLSQIGNLYGISAERVRQIIEKTITNIRNSQAFDDYKIIE